MYKNRKIIVNTAAGRRRYMQYLIPFVVASDIVDRYDIWVNTHNGADIEFFKKCAEKFSKINLVWQPDGLVDGIKSINAFYKGCCEENTIYFKLDDDVVWMGPGLIEKMVDFRINNPQYFLVSPLVVNNALSTYLLQLEGKLKLNRYYPSYCSDDYLWKSGKFAAELHEWFREKYLKTERYSELYIGKREMGMCRFSINSILWFGEDMAAISGIVPGDDEEFLSCIYPTKLGKSNAWNGDAIISHFAFFPQREELDKMQILEKYGEYLHLIWAKDPKMSIIDDTVQGLLEYVQQNESYLMAQPSPYRHANKEVNNTRECIKRIIPQCIRDYRRDYLQKRNDKNNPYIIG